VIFVPGSGIYDRDALLGKTKTPREFIFKDLASRMEARGIATIRADGRGVRYGAAPGQYLDNALLATRTTGTMSEDLAAVYDWSLAADGLGARCIVFFAHSEGMLHIGRLADRGAPAPALIIGMGAAMQSPMHIMRWQAARRISRRFERLKWASTKPLRLKISPAQTAIPGRAPIWSWPHINGGNTSFSTQSQPPLAWRDGTRRSVCITGSKTRS